MSFMPLLTAGGPPSSKFGNKPDRGLWFELKAAADTDGLCLQRQMQLIKSPSRCQDMDADFKKHHAKILVCEVGLTADETREKTQRRHTVRAC